MNLDQVLSLLRVLLSVGGPVGALLVARGMSAEDVTVLSTSIITICGAVPPVVAAVWGAFAHTNASKIASVTALPGVAAVVVKLSADDGVAAAAADPTQPKVLSAVNVTLPKGATK
jgi:hypothetical protein